MSVDVFSKKLVCATLALVLVQACSQGSNTSDILIPQLPTSCATGWFSFSSKENHILSVDQQKLQGSRAAVSVPVHILINYLRDNEIISGMSPHYERASTKLSALEPNLFPLEDGIGFNIGSSGLKRTVVSGQQIKTEKLLDGNNIENISQAVLDKIERTVPIASYTSRLLGDYYISGVDDRSGDILLVNTKDQSVTGLQLPEGSSTMFLLDQAGQPRLFYTRIDDTNLTSRPHTVLIPNEGAWVPPNRESARRNPLPQFLLSVKQSYVPDQIPVGDYILRGQADHRFSRSKVDLGQGVEQLISIDDRAEVAIDFDAIGYSYETETVYWVSKTEADEGITVASSLDWLLPHLKDIVSLGGQELHVSSANENSILEHFEVI